MQQKTREMERKYRDAMANKDEVDTINAKLKSRNNELELELQDVDRLAKRLETDKSFVLKTADREMTEAKVICRWKDIYFSRKKFYFTFVLV